MSITSAEQFEKLRACGAIAAKALRVLAAQVRVGVTTAELAETGSKVLAEHGARSSPPVVYGFSGDVSISVNDEVVHGIPGDRVLCAGDLLKLDLTAEKNGYHTDSAVTVEVPPSQSNEPAHELAAAPNARFASRSARRAQAIAQRKSAAPSNARCGVAVSASSANLAAMASAAPFARILRCRTEPIRRRATSSRKVSSSLLSRSFPPAAAMSGPRATVGP